jgi:hypothetical protein
VVGTRSHMGERGLIALHLRPSQVGANATAIVVATIILWMSIG